MRCRHTDDVDEFLAATGDWLRRRPVEHSVILTSLESRRSGRNSLTAPPLLAWAADDGGEPVGAFMHTPPFPSGAVAVMPEEAARALAAYVRGLGHELGGVGGLVDPARAFAAEWVAADGGTVTEVMGQGLYAVRAPAPPAGVPGRLRLACPDDVELAAAWAEGFVVEAGVHRPPDLPDTIAARVGAGLLSLWEVGGRAVSMAGDSEVVAGVARISWVWTPPEHRRHGYAGACVAGLSQRILDDGADAVMLYTDLANPTSNAVYQRVGYRRVGDAVQLAFGPRPDGPPPDGPLPGGAAPDRAAQAGDEPDARTRSTR